MKDCIHKEQKNKKQSNYQAKAKAKTITSVVWITSFQTYCCSAHLLSMNHDIPSTKFHPLFPSLRTSLHFLFIIFLFLNFTFKMGNCHSFSSPPSIVSRKTKKPLPIHSTFTLPSPLPSFPSGEGFASGSIDLGGLQVCQISTFKNIWTVHESGPDNVGASFFEPSLIPEGYFMLGCYAQPNNKPLSGYVLVGKDNIVTNPTLEKPIDYTLVWSSASLKIKQDGFGYIWLPTPPDGYKAVGLVVTATSAKPSLDKIRCVRSEFTEQCENSTWVWGDTGSNGLSVYVLTPSNRGVQGLGVQVGTFTSQVGGGGSPNISPLACLKNINTNLFSNLPNFTQIQALIQAYSPLVYFHPDEEYLPSSVEWFFNNGALLYKKGQESQPVRIDSTGSNLPQGESNDGAYWLDLPIDNNSKNQVKKGDLGQSEAYLHVKPMFGATFTDIAIWIFYPFNGPARVKIQFINISLDKIGQHVGDWEHITLRISNFNGELKSVYFSEHSTGTWVDASMLEFANGNKPVAYSSLHGHALYSKPGLVLQGSNGIGIRNDTAKSTMVMDIGDRFSIVAAEYLGTVVMEPPWLNYFRKWGPKISYDLDAEINKIEKLLPGKLKSAFSNVVRSLPSEVLGEEGPTGPKMKSSWYGDEN